VSVIVPARNASDTIEALLRGLARQERAPEFETIIVDDGSTDDTVELAVAAGAQVIEQDGQGPGEARNRGVEFASAELIAFIDADCVPTPGWLAAGVAALGDADLVQGAVHADPGIKRLPFDRTVWVTRESGLYECASLFVRRDAFAAVGGFEDLLGARMGKQLGEDAWLGWRIRRSGARTKFSSKALVHHAVFRRTFSEYVSERLRAVYFPSLAREIPELREAFFFRRLFLSPRSGAFDLALVAAIGAGLVSPWLGLLALPYGWIVVLDAVPWRLRAPVAAAAGVASDAVAFAALAFGSARTRTLVL